MTRRSRRASSAPQRVGSDDGLTSSRPAPERPGEEPPASAGAEQSSGVGEVDTVGEADRTGEGKPAREGGGRHTRPKVEQTKDDTDEGWGEPGDDDATARWLRENRPPHWS